MARAVGRASAATFGAGGSKWKSRALHHARFARRHENANAGTARTGGCALIRQTQSTGTLTAGTVLTVINNTSASPITGSFSNLPKGSTFASNGNNFQVSYEGRYRQRSDPDRCALRPERKIAFALIGHIAVEFSLPVRNVALYNGSVIAAIILSLGRAAAQFCRTIR